MKRLALSALMTLLILGSGGCFSCSSTSTGSVGSTGGTNDDGGDGDPPPPFEPSPDTGAPAETIGVTTRLIAPEDDTPSPIRFRGKTCGPWGVHPNGRRCLYWDPNGPHERVVLWELRFVVGQGGRL